MIKVKREFERIQKKICRHKMSIMFNEICINEEMLPKYTYIYIYIYREREREDLVLWHINNFRLFNAESGLCIYIYIYIYIYDLWT